ncbi:MAG: DUF2162 family putative transporter [Desulfococcaceae bacterium]
MELKSLFLGMVLCAGIFAAKNGTMLGDCMEREKHRAKDPALCLALICIYGLVFGISAIWLLYADNSFPVQTLQVFLKSGMLLHFFMAVCMLVQGLIWLKPDRNRENRVQLSEPVFVCSILIILSAASAEFFPLYFPNTAVWAVFCLCLGFTAIILLFAFLSKYRFFRMPGKTAGAAMLTLAAYFVLSAAVLPQFSDLGEIAGLAAHSHEDGKTGIPAVVIFVAFHGILFASGYLKMSEKIRRTV